jgi:ABC-type antimicrobial peptide transport system permease subunit
MDANTGVEKLTRYFTENHIPLKAITWSKAIGMMGQLAVIMKSALYIFVGFIFFVAGMIIMNTLSMAAMERVTEIGMMRAVGATRAFVSRMFIVETFILAIIFGGAGVAVGGGVVKWLSYLKLSTQNEIMQILYGGDTFHPILDPSDFAACFITLMIVTILSVIYPIILARRITPLDSMSRE